MSEVIRFALLGMGTGALYALTAQGMVLIYRGSGVVNFAQGAMGMVGAFIFYELRDDHQISTPLAVCIVLLLSIGLGVATHLFVMRPLRESSAMVRLVSTLGLFSFLVAAGMQRWGSGAQPVDSILPTTPRYPFGDEIAVGEDRLWLIVISLVVTVLLWGVYRYSRFGAATEAVADNTVAASALGHSPDVLAAANWAVGAVLATITAILIAPVLFLSVAALSFTVLRALAAALVGGFRNFWLTLLGAFGIGIAEAELLRFLPEHPGVSRSAAFAVIVIVLVVSGRALPLRRELLDRLPALGSGVVNVKALASGVVLAVALVLMVPDKWAVALSVTMAMAIVGYSVVVVTGYIGQLSLAQFALAGFGAWVAGRIVHNTGVTFLLAVLIGVAAAVPLGLLVALPALRTRGVNLAAITFGLATMLYELLLNNSRLTGNLQGTDIGEPHLLGVDVNGVDHPERYAAVVLAFLVLTGLGVANLRRSTVGRRLIAVRSNERAAAALGVSVFGAKLYAFGLAAGLAALGGILLSFRQDSIAYTGFTPFMSIQVVVFAVIGGIGFAVGPLVGSMLVVGGIVGLTISELSIPIEWLEIAGGAILVLMLLRHPDGLAAEVGHKRRPRVDTTEVLSKRPVRSERPDATRLRPRPTTLEVEGLTVRFGGVVALSGVSLSVAAGEVVGLIGPNGAGKTTLIDAVTGFVAPSEGRVRLGGEEIQSWSPRRRSSAGLARSFQSLELFDELSVSDNIQVACDSRSPWLYLTDLLRPGRQDLSVDARAVVTDLALDPDLHRMPGELSYGHRRLVAIARAVATRPSVLLLDEPAAGLGEHETRELGDVIVELARTAGIGILLVEHDVEMVMRVSDRIVAMNFGMVLAEGTPSEVRGDSGVIASYLGGGAPQNADDSPPEVVSVTNPIGDRA